MYQNRLLYKIVQVSLERCRRRAEQGLDALVDLSLPSSYFYYSGLFVHPGLRFQARIRSQLASSVVLQSSTKHTFNIVRTNMDPCSSHPAPAISFQLSAATLPHQNTPSKKHFHLIQHRLSIAIRPVSLVLSLCSLPQSASLSIRRTHTSLVIYDRPRSVATPHKPP